MENLKLFNEFLAESVEDKQPWVIFKIMNTGLYKKEEIVNSHRIAKGKANKMMDNITSSEEGVGYMTLSAWEKHVKNYKIQVNESSKKIQDANGNILKIGQTVNLIDGGTYYFKGGSKKINKDTWIKIADFTEGGYIVAGEQYSGIQIHPFDVELV